MDDGGRRRVARHLVPTSGDAWFSVKGRGRGAGVRPVEPEVLERFFAVTGELVGVAADDGRILKRRFPRPGNKSIAPGVGSPDFSEISPSLLPDP